MYKFDFFFFKIYNDYGLQFFPREKKPKLVAVVYYSHILSNFTTTCFSILRWLVFIFTILFEKKSLISTNCSLQGPVNSSTHCIRIFFTQVLLRRSTEKLLMNRNEVQIRSCAERQGEIIVNSNKYDGVVWISFIYYETKTVNRKGVVNECYQYSNTCIDVFGMFEYFKYYLFVY